jgi:SRSO17 transposase
MTSEQIASLQPPLAKLVERFGPCFERHTTLGYLEKYILGLLSDVKRKSVEPIALAAGLAVRTLQGELKVSGTNGMKLRHTNVSEHAFSP